MVVGSYRGSGLRAGAHLSGIGGGNQQAFLGLFLTLIFLASGSLLVAMLVHVVIDLRLLLMPGMHAGVEGSSG